MNDEWVLPFGAAREDEWDVAIRPGRPGWSHTGLLVVELADGESRGVETGDDEYVVLPLAGGGDVAVVCGEHRATLAGRADVFSGPADVAYVPRAATFTITARGPVKVALCTARAKADVPFSVVRAADVPVELRGAGQCSRQVQNFGTPGTLEASSIIACEVVTPAGNWSSYPPHKHDTQRDGVESELEEIYYFELRTERSEVRSEETPAAGAPGSPGGQSGGGAPRPMGYQCVYGTDDRPIDVKAQVATGDVVLVPHGWHGPAMAVPGYDMYYLNVMAGPGQERVWLICDDPAHGWIRDTWERQDVDPRLPLHIA